MARRISLEQVRGILNRRAFGEFVGVAEDETFECKEMPYQLAADHGNYELAKDVSAFANAGGGVIVCGVRTGRPDPAHPQDEVTDVRTMPQPQANVQQHHDVLRAWTFHPQRRRPCA
jgi:predicted HTH transcriptional regulator